MLRKIILNCFIILVANLIQLRGRNPFEVMPINTHFNGIVKVNTNIIAYGTGGVYCISSDKGEHWEKFVLKPNITIRKIYNQNDTLWGISDEGDIFWSFDFGRNWNIYHYENIDKEEFFANLVVVNDYLYIRTKYGLLKFDKKMNLIKSLRDSSLTLTKSDFFVLRPYKGIQLFNYPYSQLFSTSKFIIVNLTKPILNSLGIKHFGIINFDLDGINFIDVSDKVLIDNLDTSPGILNNVIEVDSVLYIQNGHFPKLYKTTFDFDNWSFCFKDTNAFLLRKVPGIGSQSFFLYNNNILSGFTKSSKVFNYIDIYSLMGANNLGIYSFGTVNDLDTFFVFGSEFENHFYVPPPGKDFPDRITSVFSTNSKYFVEIDSNFIFVGPYNTILLAKNNFKEWHLISSLNSQPYFILNDSTFIFINKSLNDIDISSNGGTTFVPTSLGLNNMIDTIIWVDTLFNPIDTIIRRMKVTFLPSLKNFDIFYLDSTGKGFFIGTLKSSKSGIPSFGITNDFFKAIKFLFLKNVDPFSTKFPSNAFLFDNKVNFFISFVKMDTLISLLYFIEPSQIDLSLDTIVASYFQNSFYFLQPFYIWQSDYSSFYIFAYAQDSSKLWRKTIQIFETTQPSFLKNPIISIDEYLDFYQFYPLNADTLFFTAGPPATLYLLDRKRNKLDTLFSDENLGRLWLILFDEKFYLFSDDGFLE
ncbi:MAG: WD40/YVTN/BNR-like repeat-containing protein, partial [Candidatus Kapaibacteriota bacterium]